MNIPIDTVIKLLLRNYKSLGIGDSERCGRVVRRSEDRREGTQVEVWGGEVMDKLAFLEFLFGPLVRFCLYLFIAGLAVGSFVTWLLMRGAA